jgi:hypothetical protein
MNQNFFVTNSFLNKRGKGGGKGYVFYAVEKKAFCLADYYFGERGEKLQKSFKNIIRRGKGRGL